jgi:glycosyltransferase involved in cell wall biosynthesis
MSRRIFIVQYAGDYREAHGRLAAGGPEKYRGQRYTVDAVANLTRFGEVATMSLQTEAAYDEPLACGVRAIGLGMAGFPSDFGPIQERIAAWVPTHLVVRLLSADLLDWASQREMRTLAMLAETHANRGGLIGLLQKWRNARLAEILNRPRVEWVTNHHHSATNWLKEIGVGPGKLIPYDYEYPLSPDGFGAKALRASGPWVVAYAGMIIDGKGVGDLIEAVARLARKGVEVELRLAGSGEVEKFQKQALKLGVESKVTFVGTIAADDVVKLMRDADAVVVPSRKDYSESFGFVVQEAFLSRTPLVASDHRAFEGRVIHEKTGLVFKAGDPRDLAEKLSRLLTDRKLYHKLSEASAAAWRGMQIEAKWAEVIERWVSDTPKDVQWLRDHAIPKS